MNRLKRARLLAEKTQAQLAREAGITVYRIQRIEYGWSSFKGDELRRVSKALNTKQSELTEA